GKKFHHTTRTKQIDETHNGFPGKSSFRDMQSTTEQKDLKASTLLDFSTDEASAKVRTDPPQNDEEAYARVTWAGVVPLNVATGRSEERRGGVAGATIPEYIQSYTNR